MINSLYIGRSGLDTAKYSVDVTSNNIANENTEGYIKRTINTSELTTLEDDIGNGVSFDSVTRSTSVYLYDKLVSQDSLSSYYEAEDSILSNVEMMFSETENTGFSSTLSNYFDSVETLRGDPTNLIYKNDFFNFYRTIFPFFYCNFYDNFNNDTFFCNFIFLYFKINKT